MTDSFVDVRQESMFVGDASKQLSAEYAKSFLARGAKDHRSDIDTIGRSAHWWVRILVTTVLSPPT